MNWESIKSTVAKYAPVAGSLLGGPAGGAIGGLIASTLGVESTPAAIEHAIEKDPSAMVKLKKFDHQYRTRLAELSFMTLKAELSDKQHARATHKDHWMPALLTLLLALMVAGMFWSLIWGHVPESLNNVLLLLVGQVVAAFTTAIAYWLGTSRSSKEKNDKLVAK